MTKTAFEQQEASLASARAHELALNAAIRAHELSLLDARHTQLIAAMKAFGEELRTSLKAGLDGLMPIYQHIGPEATATHLRHQTEQSVALFAGLFENALKVAAEKFKADAEAKKVSLDTQEMLDKVLDLAKAYLNRDSMDEDDDEGECPGCAYCGPDPDDETGEGSTKGGPRAVSTAIWGYLRTPTEPGGLFLTEVNPEFGPLPTVASMDELLALASSVPTPCMLVLEYLEKPFVLEEEDPHANTPDSEVPESSWLFLDAYRLPSEENLNAIRLRLDGLQAGVRLRVSLGL